MRATVAAMSMETVSTGASGSDSFSKRPGRVLIVKRAGSRRAVTSFQRSGHEAGAPGSERTENGPTTVRPWPFWGGAGWMGGQVTVRGPIVLDSPDGGSYTPTTVPLSLSTSVRLVGGQS